MSSRTFLKILEELGWPDVFLVTPKQFEKVEGDKIKDNYGMSASKAPAITVRAGLRGKALANTIYHEIGHLLFPYKKHWWIEAAAEKLARGGGRGYYCNKYGHSIDDLPSRDRLLKSFRRAAKRFNLKSKSA